MEGGVHGGRGRKEDREREIKEERVESGESGAWGEGVRMVVVCMRGASSSWPRHRRCRAQLVCALSGRGPL